MSSAKRIVLLVEDSPEVRRLAKTYLVNLGHEVIEASDGKAAMAKLSNVVPDLVCLDLMLPELSGYELCEHIRATPTTANVPILIMSARNLPTDRAHVLEAGANAFLTKPFSYADFSKQVGKLLSPSSLS